MSNTDQTDVTQPHVDNIDVTTEAVTESATPEAGTQDVVVELESPETESPAEPEIKAPTDDLTDAERLRQEKEELEQKFNSLRGKVSSLEKAANEKDQTNYLKALDAVFEKDPVAYDRWRSRWVEMGNRDPGSHEALYGINPDSNVKSSTGIADEVGVGSNVRADLQRIKQELKQELKQEEDLDKGALEFFEEVPELDPRKLTDGDERKEKGELFKQVATIAGGIKGSVSGISTKEALIRALSTFPEYSKKVLNRAMEAGELSAYAKINAKGAGAISGAGGVSQSGIANKRITMTAIQRDKYEEIKRTQGQTAATIFAEEVARYNAKPLV